VAGSCGYGDEPAGSGAMELISYPHSETVKQCPFTGC
jgi:hypothetical protein